MLRTAFTKAARPSALRTLSTTARAMGAGDTGSPPRTGGAGDAFQRRERAAEEMAIRKIEHEKLKALKEKLKQQQEHLQQLSDHIDDITKNQGGENN